MNRLILLDFDKTLVPFDSFRKYIFIWLKYYPFFILFFLIIRKLRFISSTSFKHKILIKIRTHHKFEAINGAFAEYLFDKINFTLFNDVKNKATERDVILLLSASPDSYISLIGNRLCIYAKGSYFTDQSVFIHLYANIKIDYIKREYPMNKYLYYYSVSDSKTDLKLLNMFQSFLLYKK